MIKIIADDKIPFLRGVLEPYAVIKYLPGRQIDWELLPDAEALLIRTRTKCTKSLLKDTRVRFIGTATIGFDHIDTRFCDSHGIKWTNAPGCNSSSVQQYIAAALLKMSLDFRFSLKDKTLGIIGVGNVGSKVEKLAKALGMRVLLNDPPRAKKEGEKLFVDLETVLRESDIVTLHVPLNIVGEDKTYHFINEKTIKKMKKGVWFINSSRGEVAETSAVKKALDTGRFSGAVIDVWENEPDLDIELMHKTFIATPHIAGYSTDGKANGTAMIVNALAGFFKLPLNDWYPGQIPGPQNPVISINGKGKNDESVIGEAIAHTYNISEDDLKLRFSPADFEKERGDYPVRREFSSFEINIKNGTKKVLSTLGELGFTVNRPF
jgi:erythronate-4-phosphate dehydrogenase